MIKADIGKVEITGLKPVVMIELSLHPLCGT